MEAKETSKCGWGTTKPGARAHTWSLKEKVLEWPEENPDEIREGFDFWLYCLRLGFSSLKILVSVLS